VLCTGHIWAEVASTDAFSSIDDLAVVRIEQLYPFPEGEVAELLHGYREAADIVWVQEEPANMGAWPFVEPRLRSLVGNRHLRYVGRPERASPAEGWAEAHVEEQRRIISEVFAGVSASVR
jgi:2-oxoglutarate dehydrogenase E1 component